MVHLVIEFGYTTKRNDPMKFLLVILLFCSSSYSQSQDKIPANIQKKLDEAIDHYNVSLYKESKTILLNLLYSSDGGKYEAEIRYHLGLASYWEGKTSDAYIQWRILRKKYPTSNRSRELSRLDSKLGDESNEKSMHREEELEFNEDLKFGELFWDYSGAKGSFLWGELKDPNAAIKYYEKLYEGYDDPNKKYKISLRLLLLYGGYNDNKYGYNKELKARSGTVEAKQYNKNFSRKVNSIFKQMEENISGELDLNFPNFVMWNYFWAVRLSDSQAWSEKVKANKESEIYFGKVISLTNSQPQDIYRTFSIMWLEDDAKKYVISEKEMADYLSFGLTNDIFIELSGRGIPKELWRDLSQRGYDFSTIVDDASFIRSVKLEKLLIEANLVEGYSFANLRSELKKFDGWHNLFTNHNIVSFNNKELLQWLETQFDCKEENCLLPIINSYKQNIGSELMLQSKKSSLQVQRENQMFIPFLPISTFIVMKLNDISPKDFVTLFIKNRDMLY